MKKSLNRRILSALLCCLIAVAACFGLVACDNDNQNGGGKNSDKSFAMVASWTTSGLVNHYNSNTSCNAYDYFVVEGLYRYVRSTDEIFCQLAAEMPTHSKASIDEYKDVMGDDAYDY